MGHFKTAGQEWQPVGQPERVHVYDFPSLADGKATPYSLDDLRRHAGGVTVGRDHDTAPYAVASIRRWWGDRGRTPYPGAKRLTIVADGGGSNGYRVRRWKAERQRSATDLDLTIQVSHRPPGTSQGNKIEHRLFSVLSRAWRGRPLTRVETLGQCIASATTTTGLTIHAEYDAGPYPTGIVVTDEKFQAVHLTRDAFHGEWNYTITP